MFENTDSTDPEVTTELSESNYYKELDSSGEEEGINTSDFYPTSSDYEGNTSDNEPVQAKGPGIFLVASGVCLWLITAALFLYWYRTTRRAKEQGDLGRAERGEAKGEGKGKVMERGGTGPSSKSSAQEDVGVIDVVKANTQDEWLSSAVTKEALIGAISLATAGIEDTSARIQRQIAAGGSGVVYKGVWKNIPVAIKTVVFQDLSEKSNRQRQRAVFEAAISSSVAHKNIVQTYAYSFKRLHASSVLTTDFKDPKQVNIESANTATGVVVDWKLYIVQEFCDGGSLRECLDGKKVHDAESGHPKLLTMCRLAFEAASGMNHLHTQHNIVHGDLSSKNILLKRDPGDGAQALGVAKIADFGLSIKMGLLQSHISNQRAGTPFYMAPELCHQGILSKKADVFSFGVFMWELYHSKKCYHMNPKTGMQYHPLFPKFPIMCPIPYAMLCVVCISPKPENRPGFEFIARVFEALKQQLDSGMFADFEAVRVKNMGLAAGLGRMSAPKIMELIADQVGISVEPPGGECSSPGQEEVHSVLSEASLTNLSNSMKFPHSMFLPSNQLWGQAGATGADATREDEEVHLSQAYVAPFNCVVTVSVSTERDPDAPRRGGQCEHFDIAWECEAAPRDEVAGATPEEGEPSSSSKSPGGGCAEGAGYSVRNNPCYGSKSAVPRPVEGGRGAATEALIARRMALSPRVGRCPGNSSCGGEGALDWDAPNSAEWSESGGEGTARRMPLGRPSLSRVSPRVSPRRVPRAMGGRVAGTRQEREVSSNGGLCRGMQPLPAVQEECDGTTSGGVSSSAVTTIETEDTIDVQSAFMPSDSGDGAESEHPDAALMDGLTHSDSGWEYIDYEEGGS